MTRMERRRERHAETTFHVLVAVLVITILILLFLISASMSGLLRTSTTEPLHETKSEVATEEPEAQEDYENEKIQAALIAGANRIDGCNVTWYTADTCNKKPGDIGYGITKSGLPVVEHLTCAVDPEVIPLYSDVFVQYVDGTIEQLWATDTGVKGESLDIYTPDYDYAIQCGRQRLTVWWTAPQEG